MRKTQTRLIEDLLDVSSVMTGKLRLHLRSVEVLEMVRTAIEAIAPAAAAKSITIDTSLDLSAGSITVDPERLQQIVCNLLSNAVKFTPPRGHVNVAVAKLENEVAITVTDTGAGIAPDFLPHVFEYFRQADTSSARRHGGLGLGLAIVRSLTELHGGSVSAESDGANQGFTFTVAPRSNSSPRVTGAQHAPSATWVPHVGSLHGFLTWVHGVLRGFVHGAHVGSPRTFVANPFNHREETAVTNPANIRSQR
jgi:K+-sensing histidine kinase KdpD